MKSQDRMGINKTSLKLPDGLEICGGHLNMYRCPKCKRENYILNVTSGICTWCGYNANKDYPIKQIINKK